MDRLWSRGISSMHNACALLPYRQRALGQNHKLWQCPWKWKWKLNPRAPKSEEMEERIGSNGPLQDEFQEVANRKNRRNRGRGGPGKWQPSQDARFSQPGIATPRFPQPGMPSSGMRFPHPRNGAMGPNSAQLVAPHCLPHPDMATQFYQRTGAPAPLFPPRPAWGAPPPPLHISRPLLHPNVAQITPLPQPQPSADVVIGTLLPSEKQRVPIISSSHVTVATGLAPMPSSQLSENDGIDDDDDDDDSIFNSSGSDGLEDDSDASVKSLETVKKSKLWKDFFMILDGLPLQEVNNQDRLWHCPVCKGGVGAIEWYKGLQALGAHAKNMKTRRISQHRKFEAILDAELKERGTSSGVDGATYGMWSGLKEDNETNNVVIVWPPMVMIQNTRLELGDDEKWIGMGNKELLDMFKEHKPMKAKHSYSPDGHRGISILVFESSPAGYYNAESLGQAFAKDRRGRKDWDSKARITVHPGGKRVLYGYYAIPEDLTDFGKHNSAKQPLKWELQHYKDKVLNPLQKMGEDFQTASYLTVKVENEKKQNKVLIKTVHDVRNKLKMREEEVKIVQKRSHDMKHIHTIEMEDMETHFQAERAELIKELDDKEETINKLRESYEQACAIRSHHLEQELSGAEQKEQTKIQNEINNSRKNYAEFKRKEEELWKMHHQKRKEFKRKQYQEELEFVKALKDEETRLFDDYKKRLEMQAK